MAFNEYRKPLTAAQRRAAKLNGGKPAIDASKLCTDCLQQLLCRRTLADPSKFASRAESTRLLQIGYVFCSTCSDVLGTSDPSKIDYTPVKS